MTGTRWNWVARGCTPEQPHVGAEISHKGMETETFPVLWAVARTCGGDANDAFLGQRSFA